jgi:hypothetical protein
MSTSIAFALLVANTLVGIYLVIHFSQMAIDLATVIVTGVSGGMPLPLKYRWLLLHQTWTSHVLAAFGVAGLGTMVDYGLLEYVTGSTLRVVAWAFVFMGVMTTLAVMFAGFVEYPYYRSVLREAKRD